MSDEIQNTIEIRGFLHLNKFFREKGWPIPYLLKLEENITGLDLAYRLGISSDEIEVIFVNGFVQGLDYIIKPGDRVAFLPPGCPGPYRIALGFYGKNQANEANFKLKNKF